MSSDPVDLKESDTCALRHAAAAFKVGAMQLPMPVDGEKFGAAAAASMFNSEIKAVIDTDPEAEAKLLVKARMLVLAHCMVRFKYDSVIVSSVCDPSFRNVLRSYWAWWRVGLAVTKFLLLCVFTVSLPMLYGHFSMEYPCDPQKVIIDDREMTLAARRCSSQDLIRSWLSMLLVPSAAGVGASLVLGSRLIDMLLRCCCCIHEGYGVGPGKIMRDLGKRLIHKVIDQTLTNPKYTAPICHDMVGTLYFAIMVEMVFVSILQNSAVALLSGLAVMKAFLMCADVMLAPDAALRAKVDAELQEWPAVGPYSRTSASGMLDRLRRQTHGTYASTIFATTHELNALYTLVPLRELVETNWRKVRSVNDLNTFKSPPIYGARLQYCYDLGWAIGDIPMDAWKTYPARYVYLADQNRTIDVGGSVGSRVHPSSAEPV